MKTTNEMLDEATAEALGWTDIVAYQNAFDRPGSSGIRPGTKMGVPPGGTHRRKLPDYCADRNALPEMKNAIIQAAKWEEFSHHLRHICERESPDEFGLSRTMTVVFAEPRWIVEAFLKALGHWKPEWNEENSP